MCRNTFETTMGPRLVGLGDNDSSSSRLFDFRMATSLLPRRKSSVRKEKRTLDIVHNT